MKSKDQQLLEEAYNQVSSAKIVRRATEEELKQLREYCNEAALDDERFGHIFLKGLDLTKGWVWDIEDEGDFFVSVRDSTTKARVTKMKGYTTFGLSSKDKEDVYWMGQVDFNYAADSRAIEEFEKFSKLKKELPELEGVF
jgi:hypothetical protein